MTQMKMNMDRLILLDLEVRCRNNCLTTWEQTTTIVYPLIVDFSYFLVQTLYRKEGVIPYKSGANFSGVKWPRGLGVKGALGQV